MDLKKLLSLLLIFCLVFSFVACGSRDVDDDDDNGRASSSRRIDEDDEDDEDDEGGKGRGKDKDKDKGEDEDVDEDNDEDEDKKDNDKDDDDDAIDNDDEDDKDSGSIKDIFAAYPKGELPKGYPIDKYPIYKDGHVWMGMEEDQGGYSRFTVAVVYAEKFDTIDQYFADYLKDADDYNDVKSPVGNDYKGTMDGYKFEIIIANTAEGLVSATIALTEIPSADSVLKSLDVAELPAGFPVSDFPIIDGAALFNVSESESDGLVSYTLDIYTDKTIKEIIGFYDDNLTNVEDKSKSSDNNGFNISGSSNGYYFYISGYKEIEDNVELIRYFIEIIPI
ncbi:MAG: hypothetical protein ACOX4T_11495 [Acetivibrionales bacterium]|jgi:hypothetical protein